MRSGSVQHRKPYDTQKAGCMKQAGRRMKASDVWTLRTVGVLITIFVFLSLARMSAEEKENIRGNEKTCVTIDRRIGGGFFWFIYTPVFAVS